MLFMCGLMNCVIVIDFFLILDYCDSNIEKSWREGRTKIASHSETSNREEEINSNCASAVNKAKTRLG